MREHLRFLVPLFGLIAAVWALRLIVDATAPGLRLARFFSMTAAAPLSVLLAVLMIHFRRFGGYANVVVASLLVIVFAQLMIVLAIVFSVVTGIDNVFTRPEFSNSGADPYHFKHIIGHLTFGIGGMGLIGVGMGCVLLFLLRLLVPNRPPGEKEQAGIEG